MDTIQEMLRDISTSNWFSAIVLLVLGLFAARLISSSLAKFFRKRLTPHQNMLLRQILFYFIFILFLVSAIQQMGFQISALLGATGILTVAIGIASQTSMSNLVSGIFIIGEKPFEIGDTVIINGTQGEVLSIDFLSVKLRLNDNTMVRIPNETLIKSAITNLSYFSTRRIDLLLHLPYKTSIDSARHVLLDVAAAHPECLTDPKPCVTVNSLGDTGVVLLFTAWTAREKLNALKNTLQEEIKIAFDKNKIELGTQPLPVRVINE